MFALVGETAVTSSFSNRPDRTCAPARPLRSRPVSTPCANIAASVAARALALRRVSQESPAARLLASDRAPGILAIVAEHFDEGTRRRPAVEVYELMVQDFRALRGEFDMPRKPQEYVNTWVRAGWFNRTVGTAHSGELLELSEDALYVRDVMARWEAPQAAVAASRTGCGRSCPQERRRNRF